MESRESEEVLRVFGFADEESSALLRGSPDAALLYTLDLGEGGTWGKAGF